MDNQSVFNKQQIQTIENVVVLAEELVADAYKLSHSQWRNHRYDIKTLSQLTQYERVAVPFAHLVRYRGKKKESDLSTSSFDYYHICLQDPNILAAYIASDQLIFFPFMLYIITHELIHIVRFSQFLQNFNVSPMEKLKEEKRVHQKTKEVLKHVKIPYIEPVLNYKGWEINP